MVTEVSSRTVFQDLCPAKYLKLSCVPACEQSLMIHGVMETAGPPVCVFGQQNPLEAIKPETKDSWNTMHQDDLFLGTLPQAFNHL